VPTLCRDSEINILQIDAHPDLYDELGVIVSPMPALCPHHEASLAKRLVQIGVLR
jgi:arginase family enzyme